MFRLQSLILLSVSFCFLSNGYAAEKRRSVYTLSPTLDISLIAVGSLVTGISYACASQLTNKRCPCDGSEVNSFDRSIIGNHSAFAATFSDVLVASAVAGPLLLDWADLGWSPELLEDAVILAEVLAVNSLLVTVVKFTVQRPIPRAYEGLETDSTNSYHAFYSGHTSTAVSALAASAMTLQLRYQTGIWPWLGVGAIGTGVGLLRVAAGNHFYTDIIAGAVIGAGVGILVPWLHRKESTESHFTVAPLGQNGASLLYLYSF